MIKTYIHTLGTKIFAALLNLLIVVLLANYLGTDGKGEQSLILTTISLTTVVCALIGSGSLVFLIPRKPLADLLIPSYLWAVVVSVLLFYVLPVFNFIQAELIVHVSVLSGILSITGIHQSVLQSKKQINSYNILFLVQVVSTTVALLSLFLLSKANIAHYITALYTGYGCSFLLSVYYVAPNMKKLNLKNLHFFQGIQQLFKYGKYNQLATITQMLSFRASYYILFSIRGKDDVGLLSTGFAIGEAIWIIGRSFAVPLHSEIVNHQTKSESHNLTLKLFKATLVISFAGIIPFLLIPDYFYSFIFGKGFELVKPTLLLLAPGIVVYSTAIILAHYFTGTGQHKVNSIASFSGLVFMVFFCYLFIPLYGFKGAAVSCSLSYIITAGIKFYFFYKQTQFRIQDFLVKKHDFFQLKKIIKIK